MARNGPSLSIIPSAVTIRCRLENLIKNRQQNILRLLSPGSKISIALDCWISLFSQTFIAITGYFIDTNWIYREILFNFKPIYSTYTDINLSSALVKVLIEYKIENRVFGLITDNISNNKILVDLLQQILSENIIIIRILYLAYVIQLSLNQFLGYIKTVFLNNTAETK